ncbi:MAG TPA: hypothetical protein VIF15_16810 [Polyangiaceae bacterium]
MGLESECTVRVGRKTSEGRALLEGETLIFRGEFSLTIPFDSMRDLAVDGDALVVKTADQEARFELGPVVAERWMRLIKEPKGLFEKLEVGLLSRVAVVDVRDTLFMTALRERTASVAEGRVPDGAALIFFGAESRDALRRIPLLRARMMDNGILWIVRPKGSKAITEQDVYDVAKASGLVDTKVVAFSKTHTAHKCVIPVEMRGQPIRPRPPVLTIPPSAPAMQPKKGAARPAAKPSKSAAKAKPVARKAAKKPSAGKPKAKAGKK